MRIKLSAAIAFILIFNSISCAADEKPAPDKDSGIVYLMTETTIELKRDGRYIYERHIKAKVISQGGVEEMSALIVPYHTNVQTLEIGEAFTTKVDGKQIKAKDIMDTTASMSLADFTGLRFKKICMPDVEIGDTVDISYKLEHKYPQMMNENNIDLKLAEKAPAEMMRIILIVPNAVEIKYKAYNITAEPSVQSTKDQRGKIFTWEFKNMPRLEPEIDIPPLDQIIPWIRITTIKSWNDIARWYGGLIRASVTINSQMKEKTYELTKDATTELDKAKAIFRYVQSQIRYVQLEASHDIYSPHSSVDVLNNKFGDCKDKATLLLAMFKIANIEAFPALVGSGYIAFAGGIPSYEQFDHVIVMAKIGGNDVWLDPTQPGIAFGSVNIVYQDREAFVIESEDAGRFVRIPKDPAEKNSSSFIVKVFMKDTGSAEGSGSFSGVGEWANAIRSDIRERKGADRELVVQAILKKMFVFIDKATKYDITNLDDNDLPLVISFDFMSANWASVTGDYVMFSVLHQYNKDEADNILYSDPERTYPIETKAQHMSDMSVDIELPKGYRIEEMPKNKDLISPSGSKIVFSYRVEGDRIYGYYSHRTADNRQDKYPASSFELFRKYNEDLEKEFNRKVILKKAPPVLPISLPAPKEVKPVQRPSEEKVEKKIEAAPREKTFMEKLRDKARRIKARIAEEIDRWRK